MRRLLFALCASLAAPAALPSAFAKSENPASAEAAQQHYALTLIVKSGQLTTEKNRAAEQFPQYIVYQTKTDVMGRDVQLVRLGFFASFGEAMAMKEKVLARFPNARATAVSADEYRSAMAAHKAQGKRAKVAPKKIISAIAAAPAPVMPTAAPLPAVLPTTGTNKNRVAAPVATQPAAIRVAATQPVAASSSVEEEAERLMAEGRAALTAGKNAAAFQAFNRVLMLPPNRQSQEAQEYAGLARERAGEIRAAQREYELYLRLYPEGEGAERVRQRLANLAPATVAQSLKAPTKKAVSQGSFYGSLSQYYYHGASRIETTTTTATATATDTFSNTDQSALVTNLDLNGRYRTERFDNRFVFRDTNTQNFTDTADRNRLNAAYYELRDRRYEYAARLGRQPGYSGGILGRFDGGLFSYQILPKFRLDLTAGAPVEFLSELDKKFYGVNLDMGMFAERWGGATYVISQEVDGIVDRQAVGGELRYFDPKKSFFGLLDYDTLYAVVNTVLLVGNWQIPTNTTFNFLVDRRKTPAMQTSNALIGESVTRVKDLLQTLSEDEVRRYAEARTADSSLYMAGVTHPISQKWQVGGDIRLSNISETETVGTVPATPSTGDIWMYTVQAIGTGLLTGRDSSVLALSIINGETYDGFSASATNRTLVGDRWAYDTALRWYEQEDSFGTKLTRLMPTFRVSYRWLERLSLEAEIGTERAQTENASTQEDSNRDFFYAGYRWDF